MDPISITAAAITFVQTISATYSTIKHIKGLPIAFKEVGQNLALVGETLELARTQLQTATVNESTREAIVDVVTDCKKNVEKLNIIFQEIDKGKKKDEHAKDWSALVNVYRAAVLTLGKSHRVETLMQRILKKLNLLAIYQVFKKECKKLDGAIQRLDSVEPSLEDSELEQSGVNLSQSVAEGGKGNQFSNMFGTMKNNFGNEFNSKEGMSFVSYCLQSLPEGCKNLMISKWLRETSQPLPFELTQLETYQIAETVPGAGKWFLDSQNFTEWRDRELRKLWCPGIAGAGKTVLTSIIIRHLQNHCSSYRQITCIYFYFDHRQQKIQTLKSIFSTLLVQLLRNDSEICAEVSRRHNHGHEFLTEADLVEMLSSQIKGFFRVFMVIDALDECPDPHGFLEACERLPDKVRILFTSRPSPEFARIFKADKECKITADDGDLRKYLRESFSKRRELQKLVDVEQRNDATFQDNVFATIIEKSQGMFLLASLHMKSLGSSYAIHQLKEDLANLSNNPDDFYRTTLERIKKQDERSHNLAISVLSWLTFSERPLSTDELAHAIAIPNSVDSNRPQQASLPTRSEIISTDALVSPCAGLILVDKEYKTIRLAHSTAEAYFRGEKSIVQHAQSKMAETCLICLTRIPLTVSDSPTLPLNELNEYCKEYPILRYASDHWGDHLSSEKQGHVYQLAWQFLSDKLRLNIAVRFMDSFRIVYERDVSGLHLAAYFGLTKLVKKALKYNQDIALNAKTIEGRTPLHWAVRHGQEEFLQFLVDEGADPNVFDEHRKTPLHMAISDGDKASVEILLSSKKYIDLQHKDDEKWTPLRLAARNGQLKIVKMLLQKGAEVDAHDKDFWTALRWAALKGHVMIIRLLLDNGASPKPPPKAPSNDQWTLLSWAAQGGQEDIVKLLAEKRIDLDVTDRDGYTALRLAVQYGRTMTAWLLIQACANVNKPDEKGFTPLHEAVRTKNTSIFFLLLENGANINVQTKLGITPLHEAVRSENTSVLFLLLERGANVNAQTKLGLTPLHMAASQGNDSFLWLLLQKQASCEKTDSNKRTALHCATAEGHVNAVRFLIWKNPNIICAKDDEKRTALHVAASDGNGRIAEILLNNGADINSEDMHGQTPLHLAVCQEHEIVVVWLIQKGASVDIQDGERRTAADLATLSRKESIVQAFRGAYPRMRVFGPSARVGT